MESRGELVNGVKQGVEKVFDLLQKGVSTMYHVMNLRTKPFEMMAAGTKTIEYRLNDEKRKKGKSW